MGIIDEQMEITYSLLVYHNIYLFPSNPDAMDVTIFTYYFKYFPLFNFVYFFVRSLFLLFLRSYMKSL